MVPAAGAGAGRSHGPPRKCSRPVPAGPPGRQHPRAALPYARPVPRPAGPAVRLPV